MSSADLPAEYQTAEGLRTLGNYLRSQNGVKARPGIEHEKRVDYFKGKRLIESLLEAKKWPKSIPKITDKGTAHLVAGALIQGAFFHRSERIDDKKGSLKISQKNVFEDSGIYTWMYAGNMVWANVATGAVIAIVIGFTLLPIWPDFAKKILWYCSVTFLIASLAFCLVRFVLFLLLWLVGYEFWIFPRLFDESLSFQDSFKPIYTFEKGTAGQGYYRVGMMVLLSGFVYWACTQPTEFDGFIKAQRDFIDDIYSGNLLADVAHDHRETLDRTRGRVFDLEALLREMAEEEKAAIEAAKVDLNANDAGNDTLSDALSAEAAAEAEAEELAEIAQNEIDDNRLNELLRQEELESTERDSL